MKDIKKYTRSNRDSWNQALSRHQVATNDRWDASFAKPGFTALTDTELMLLTKMDLRGKNIAHPACNNGVELISLKSLGAGKCIGFDISDTAIEDATKRAEKLGVDCKFLRTDVYDIPEIYQGTFDLIYISIGCFGWMPDLDLFFQKMSLLLKDTGKVFIYELHPFADMLSTDDNENADPLKIIDPYFKNEPYEQNFGIYYIGKDHYESKPNYWFVWKVSDIIMGLVKNNLCIEFFKEYKEDISASHKKNQDAGVDIPLSYIMIANKS